MTGWNHPWLPQQNLMPRPKIVAIRFILYYLQSIHCLWIMFSLMLELFCFVPCDTDLPLITCIFFVMDLYDVSPWPYWLWPGIAGICEESCDEGCGCFCSPPFCSCVTFWPVGPCDTYLTGLRILNLSFTRGKIKTDSSRARIKVVNLIFWRKKRHS